MNTDRYIRQTLLAEIGEGGQSLLTAATVAVVGCGGLGSIAAPYLAGAGVGHIILIDGDRPDITNLHRQIIYSTGEKKSKATALADHISAVNPEIKVTVHDKMITKSSIKSLLSEADIVLECTDRILIKYLINDYCHLHQLPMIYGAIHKYDGYVSLFANKEGSSIHLRDIFPEPNVDIPSCSEVGVLGTAAGMIGLLQAHECIKYITGIGSTIEGVLLTFQGLTTEQLRLRLKKTYKADLADVYASQSYEPVSCVVPELTYSDIVADRSRYRLVSVLPDSEHRDVDALTERQPLASFYVKEWQPKDKRMTVFYCMSGMRSGALVLQLLEHNPSLQVYSLKGGLKGLL